MKKRFHHLSDKQLDIQSECSRSYRHPFLFSIIAEIIGIVNDTDGRKRQFFQPIPHASSDACRQNKELLPPRNASSDTSSDTDVGKARFFQFVGKETVSVAQSSSKHIIHQIRPQNKKGSE